MKTVYIVQCAGRVTVIGATRFQDDCIALEVPDSIYQDEYGDWRHDADGEIGEPVAIHAELVRGPAPTWRYTLNNPRIDPATGAYAPATPLRQVA